MFYGNYDHCLDEKYRLMLPKKLRSSLSEKLYIMKGFDGCVSLYNEESFLKMNKKLEDLSFNHQKERNYIRMVLSSVVELEIDSVYRIKMPVSVVKKYNLNKEITIIGALDHIEIWDRVAWLKYQESIETDFDNNAEEF